MSNAEAPDTLPEAAFLSDEEGEPSSRTPQRYGAFVRGLAGFVGGIVAGLLTVSALQVGAQLALGGKLGEWSLLDWENHWAVRAVAGLAATAVGGLIAGALARRRGALIGGLVAVPSLVFWSYFAFVGWGWLKADWLFLIFFPDGASLGNRIAFSALALLSVPISVLSGAAAAAEVVQLGAHFDSRRGTLLGVRWYHFLWIPFILHFAVAQSAAAGLYGFGWLREMFRAGLGLVSIVPMLFVFGIWSTLALSGRGLGQSYLYLTELEALPGRSRAFAIAKGAIGLPLLAALLQVGIVLVHQGALALIGKLR